MSRWTFTGDFLRISNVTLSGANLVKSSAHKSVAAGMEILLWVGQKIQDRKIARNPGCGGAKCREMGKIGKW